MIDEMERRFPRLPAVVTQDGLPPAGILGRQPLCSQQRINHLPVHRHVSQALEADGAGVGVPRVCGKAMGVHEMAAGRLLDRVLGLKQAVIADRAVACQALLDTAVLVEELQRHAGVARHAVERIHAQPPALAAEVAKGAVVDVAAGLIVKQVADGAVVAGHACATGGAGSCHTLPRATIHAHHLRHSIPIHLMLGHFIVAQPADMGRVATGRHQHAPPPVVLAAQHPRCAVVVARYCGGLALRR